MFGKNLTNFRHWKMTLKLKILIALTRLFTILVSLTMTWFSDLMPNLIKKSWTVSRSTAWYYYQMKAYMYSYNDIRNTSNSSLILMNSVKISLPCKNETYSINFTAIKVWQFHGLIRYLFWVWVIETNWGLRLNHRKKTPLQNKHHLV